jgi:aminoglycoside phosphotransferase family enzyme
MMNSSDEYPGSRHRRRSTDGSRELNAEETLVKAMLNPESYPHRVVGAIEQHETHISRVFLAGEFAYKIKKPIVSDFLDYSTAEKRHECCIEELRLNQRYADGLYENIAVIRKLDNRIAVDGPGAAIDYAVRMKRFPESDVLSSYLKIGELSRNEIDQLATSIAAFHRNAALSLSSTTFGSPSNIWMMQWIICMH